MEVICPICGCECETYIVEVSSGDIVGCDVCLTTEDAYERTVEKLENEADYHREMFMSDR